MKKVLFILLPFLTILFFGCKSEKKADQVIAQKQDTAQFIEPMPHDSTQVYVEAVKEPEVIEEPYDPNKDKIYVQVYDNVKKELKEFESSDYMGSKYSNLELIKLFDKWDEILADLDNDKFNTKVAKKLVRNLKIKEFPLLRADYVNTIREQYWENDIKIRLLGKRKDIIEFIGGTYASNRNIKKTQEAFHDAAIRYRFKKANYKWYSGADEYTYFNIDSDLDTD